MNIEQRNKNEMLITKSVFSFTFQNTYFLIILYEHESGLILNI